MKKYEIHDYNGIMGISFDEGIVVINHRDGKLISTALTWDELKKDINTIFEEGDNNNDEN